MGNALKAKNRKSLSDEEMVAFADSLEEAKIYPTRGLVAKAAAMFPDRSAKTMKYTLGDNLRKKGLCIRVLHGMYMKKYD